MPKSARVTAADVRAIYELVGECRDLGDDAARWRTHAIAGAARLAGAEVGLVYEGEWEPRFDIDGIVDTGFEHGFEARYYQAINARFAEHGAAFNPMYRGFIAARAAGAGPCLSRTEVLIDAAWYGSDYYQHYHGPLGTDAMLYCVQPLRSGRECSFTCVRQKGRRDFSAREKAVVRELQTHILGLIGGPLAGFREPAPSALRPKARAVLRCLLEGDSDKQIAARLRLSPYTVNQYVKAIFRHFGVTSRSELLARWVLRGWGGRFAWADE